MSETKRKVVDVVDIRKHSGPLMLPEGVPLPALAKAIMDRHTADEQTINASATVNAFPWETARAMSRVLMNKFGAVSEKTVTGMGFFGPYTNHPGKVEIEVGLGQTEFVPWGAPFEVPGLSGTVEIEPHREKRDGMLISKVTAQLKRMDEPAFQEIVAAVRQDIIDNSIYRGKVVKLKFDGDMPVLTFVDYKRWTPTPLRFNADLTGVIEARVLGFVNSPDLFRDIDIKPRRGVCAAGDFGTGKSQLWQLIVKTAMRANETLSEPWTVIHLEDVKDLQKALLYVRRWGRAILGGEDIDTITGGAQRDAQMNALSDALDGLESAGSAQVLLYCTTNNYDNIHPVFKRDGRFDVTLYMERPDALTIEALLRAYAGNLVSATTDLSEAANVLRGITPAAIENVVSAAKEAYVYRAAQRPTADCLSGFDFTVAAHAIIKQHKLRHKTDAAPRTQDELFGHELGKGLAQGITQAISVWRQELNDEATDELRDFDAALSRERRLASGAESY